MKTIDLTKVEVCDLDGNIQIINMSKIIANVIYSKAMTVDMVEIARDINQGIAVELTPELKEEIKNNVCPSLVMFAREGVLKLINE